MNGFFRREVIEAKYSTRMGEIHLAQPISSWLIVTASLILMAAIVAYIGCGSINDKARVIGITVPIGGTVSVVAPNDGVTIISHVEEGKEVTAGEVLFTIFMKRQTAAGEITSLIALQLGARARSLNDEIDLVKNSFSDKKISLEKNLVNFRQQEAQIKRELELGNRRLALRRESLEKYATLQNNGYVSSIQFQQKQEDLIDLEAKIVELERNTTQLHASELSTTSEITALSNTLATELTRLGRDRASLLQEIAENKARGSVDVIAQRTGIISALAVHNGEPVANGQLLAMIIPLQNEPISNRQSDNFTGRPAEKMTGQVQVQLYAPSKTAGFINIGEQVMIRYSSYPYQKFGLHSGTVMNISKTPFAPSELPSHLASTIISTANQNLNSNNSNEALYRIDVKIKEQTINIYGKAQRIQPGMTLEADIMQQRKKIWEWIIEPVMAFTATEN